MTSAEYAKRIKGVVGLKHTPLGVIERECGVATGYLSRIIKNNGKMSFDLAQKLAEQTGYTFIDILTRDIPHEEQMFKVRQELRQLEERAKGLKKLLEEEGSGE